MKRKNTYTISYWTMFALLLLLVLIVPSMAANAAEGTLTVKKFRVEDYANLRESTGHSSDITDVPQGAQTIEGVVYTLEKLNVNATDINVTISTPVDASFSARTETTDINGEAHFASLPRGYYLVAGSIPSGYTTRAEKFVVRIPNTILDANGNETTHYDVVVHPKGEKIAVEKKASSARQVVGIGDIITWDVWYPMGPDLKREEKINGVTTTSYGKNFYLTDEMDSRLDYVEGSVAFRYFDKDRNEISLILVEGVDYHLPYDADTHILRINFTDNVGTKKVADANVAYIEMKLDTVVNASALDTVEVLWNNARIFFENTSGDPYEHEVFALGTSTEDGRVPKVYLGQIVVTKVDAVDKMRLAGATFHLADSLENAEVGNFLTRQIDEQGARKEITITTDHNGEASIKAIGAGTYYLVETAAPNGYYKLTEPIAVTVANDRNSYITHLEVSNTKEGTPPEAPGQGTQGSGNPPGASNDGTGSGSGGKDFAGGVKTGDVVRMTGIFLLAIASGGIVLGMLQKKKRNSKKVSNSWLSILMKNGSQKR